MSIAARPGTIPKTMYPHHQRAADAAVSRIKEDGDALAILLGGSIAKGLEREDSDVDLIVVVDDDVMARKLSQNQASFLWTDVADWEGGYVEGRYVSRQFIFDAVERGSEPTRWSFIGAQKLWGATDEFDEAITKIPVYPERDQERRLNAFLAQLTLSRGYFWNEGARRKDRYLNTWAAVQVVLFAGRCVLAHDRILFPNQKRLMETVLKADSCPQEFQSTAEAVLNLDETARERLYEQILTLVGPRDLQLLLSRFEADSEMSWFTRSHDVAEW